MKRNTQLILKYTTAYPFRLPECSVVCVFCNESFAESSAFRSHMDDKHVDFPLNWVFFRKYRGTYVKADCTELKCRLCSVKHEHLENAAEHLQRDHHMTDLNLNCELGIYPFKLDDRFGCTKCEERCTGIRALSRHIQTHFSHHMCEACGKSFPSSSSLKAHITLSHVVGDQHYCMKCKSTFKTLEAKRKHLTESPKCWHNVCKFCNKRFMTRTQKKHHQAKEHGVKGDSYTCPECGEVFDNASAFSKHFKINHTNLSFPCSDCGLKFVTEKSLDEHKISHTNERSFPCSVCSKSFSRKRNLKQHMWIHSEQKRFECTTCKKQFNQRVSWKTHMKSYHPDIEIAPYQPPDTCEEWKKNKTS